MTHHHRATHHHHSGHATRHHHPHHAHHTRHHHQHHHKARHHGRDPITWVGQEIVHPIWKDVVKPVVALPSEALHTVDHTVSVFDSPITLLVVGGIAAAVLLRR